MDQGAGANSPSHSSKSGGIRTAPASIVIALIASAVVTIVILVAIVVRCRAAFSSTSRRGKAPQDEDGAKTGNSLDLKTTGDVTDDFSSSASGCNKDREARVARTEHAASRESLLSYRDATDVLKDSPVLQNSQGQRRNTGMTFLLNVSYTESQHSS